MLRVSDTVAVYLRTKPIASLDSARLLVILTIGRLVTFLPYLPNWISRHFALEFAGGPASSIVAKTYGVVDFGVGVSTKASLQPAVQAFSRTRMSLAGRASNNPNGHQV